MALIVEDGTGLINANSYATIADANEYFSDRAITAWDDLDDDEEKTPALIRAADYIDRTYRRQWAGVKYRSEQRLDWPRNYVPMQDLNLQSQVTPSYLVIDFFPLTPLPQLLKECQCMVALKLAQGEDLDPDLGPPVIRETVGPITTEYAAGARQNTIYTSIYNSLSPLLKTFSNNFTIERG